MTLDEYNQAGRLLLMKQRTEELFTAVMESEYRENGSEVNIKINDTSTVITERLFEKIKKAFEEELGELRNDFESI